MTTIYAITNKRSIVLKMN